MELASPSKTSEIDEYETWPSSVKKIYDHLEKEMRDLCDAAYKGDELERHKLTALVKAMEGLSVNAPTSGNQNSEMLTNQRARAFKLTEGDNENTQRKLDDEAARRVDEFRNLQAQRRAERSREEHQNQGELTRRNRREEMSDSETDDTFRNIRKNAFTNNDNAPGARTANRMTSLVARSYDDDRSEHGDRETRRNPNVINSLGALIPAFTGEDEYKVEMFIQELEDTALTKNIPPDHLLILARSRLQKSALTEARSIGITAVRTWKDFKERLISNFAEEQNLPAINMELSNCSQDSRESVKQFGVRLYSLAMKKLACYSPTNREIHLETIELDAIANFINGLKSRKIADVVRHAEATRFKKASRIAQREEEALKMQGELAEPRARQVKIIQDVREQVFEGNNEDARERPRRRDTPGPNERRSAPRSYSREGRSDQRGRPRSESRDGRDERRNLPYTDRRNDYRERRGRSRSVEQNYRRNSPQRERRDREQDDSRQRRPRSQSGGRESNRRGYNGDYARGRDNDNYRPRSKSGERPPPFYQACGCDKHFLLIPREEKLNTQERCFQCDNLGHFARYCKYFHPEAQDRKRSEATANDRQPRAQSINKLPGAPRSDEENRMALVPLGFNLNQSAPKWQ
jgi:hypothetical protein